MPNENLPEYSKVLISAEQIQERVSELAKQISDDYRGRTVLMVGILKGSVPFMVDLMRKVDVDVAIDFMSVSSYGSSTKSSGVVRILKDLDGDIQGKDVLIVEDIIDSGLTLSYLVEYLKRRNPNSLKLCTLLNKTCRRKTDIQVDYYGFHVDDYYIVGYGLDIDQKYRNLPFISYIDQA